MDEKMLITLINSGYSASKICDELNTNYDSLFSKINELKQNGTFYYPYFGNQGELYYTDTKINADDPISFKPTNGSFSFISLSDLHVGSLYDSEKRIDELQNFMLIKDLHFIFDSGDNIDGLPRSDKSPARRIDTIDKQAEEFIRIFPQAGDLATVCALGDHDLRSFLSNGVSFNKFLKANRHDIKVYSSGYGIIKIANKEIMLCHNSADPRILDKLEDSMILIGGHSHYFDKNIYSYGRGLSLRVINPSLSRLPEKNGWTSGFLGWNLDITSNEVVCVHIQEYIFDEKDKIKEGSLDHISFPVGDNNSRRRKKSIGIV